MATRARWRGDGFWDAYRERFLHTRSGVLVGLRWLDDRVTRRP